MSSTRLCIAGVLVASGLILALFTLQGYFDPHWAQKQSSTTATPLTTGAVALPVAQGRSRFVDAGDTGPPRASVARAQPSQVAPSSRSQAKTASTSPPSKASRKRVVEKVKASPAEQQASFQWPWNLFNN